MQHREVIYVAHAFNAPTPAERSKNLANARRWFFYFAELGYAPVADWILLVDSWSETRRADGLEINLNLILRCDSIALCGTVLSPGMLVELATALDFHKRVLDFVNDWRMPLPPSIDATPTMWRPSPQP